MVASIPTRARRSTGELQTTGSRPNNVLLVEDDDLVRHALKRLLVSDGRGCFAAASAENAQQMLVAHEPALVITDLNLGGRLNGIDLLLWMRRSPRLRDVPVVLMTSDDLAETRRRLDDAGLADVSILSKPFERGALANVLAHAGG
jgi:CheY-like chemotaxis protein